VTNMVTDMKCNNLKGRGDVLRQAEKVAEDLKVAAEEEAKAKVLTESKENTNTTPKVVEWSQAEQKLLEGAMKKFGPKMDPFQRWTQIAEMVGGGKGPKDCLTRVKEIKAKMVKK
jgi:hypothetical protein